MAFRKTTEVKNESVNIDYLSTTEYVAGKVDILTPEDGTSYEKRRIMYSDINGVLFDWETGNQIIETQYPYVSSIFKENDSTIGTSIEEVFPENALMYKYECTDYYYGPSIYNSTEYYIDDISGVMTEYVPIALGSVLASNLESIELFYDNGEKYIGKWQALLKRVYAEGVEVTTGTDEYSIASHEGMTVYKLTLLLSSYASNVYVRYTTGDIVESVTPGLYYPANIDPDKNEKVYLDEIYTYVPLESLEDSSEKYIVSSINTKNGFKIQTKDKGIVDSRELDFFFWRVSADFETDTNIIAQGKEIVNIGVIGSNVDEAFASFLSGDTSYSLKYTFQNPHPKSTTDKWNVKDSITLSELNNYDIIIFRDQVFDWARWQGLLNGFINNNGVVLVDFNMISPTIVEPITPTLKLNLIFNTPNVLHNTLLVDGSYSENYMFNSPSNYVISQDEVPAGSVNILGYTIAGNIGDSIVSNSDNRYLVVKAKSGTSTNGAIYVSTIGLTHDSAISNLNNISIKERMLINFIGENIKIDTEVAGIRKAPSNWTVKTPWIYSFTAGKDTDGTSLLTDTELERYNFYSTFDENGNIIWKRILSTSNAELLIKSAIQNYGYTNYSKNLTLKNYQMEISSSDNSYINYGISSSGMPWAYSTRVSDGTDLPSGFKWIEYNSDSNGSINIPENTSKSATLNVLGTLNTSDSYDFSWDAKAIARKKVSITRVEESDLTSLCPWVSDVRVETDDMWQIRHGGNSTDDVNLAGWSVTNAKWYPFDGRAWYVHNSKSPADGILFYQKALNQLSALGRTGGYIRNIPLAENGRWSTKFSQAIHDYQVNWAMRVDGVIDAGTAGHIMRNFGAYIERTYNGANIVSREFADTWAAYGDPKRLIDGNIYSVYGKRTWHNTAVTRMGDAITILLNRAVNVNNLTIRPYTLGNKPIHITGIKSFNGANWESWFSSNDSNSWQVMNDTTYGLPLVTRSATQLRLEFYQDEKIHSSIPAKMWGFRDVIFKGNITTTSITTENINTTYYNSETTISFDTPNVIRFTPKEVTAIINNFDGYVTTEAELEAYIKSTITPTRTNTNIVVAGAEVDGRYLLTLLDDIHSIRTVTNLTTGSIISENYITIDDTATTKFYVSLGISAGDVIKVEYYAVVDITVDVTFNNTTGEITVRFTQDEILENSSDIAVWGTPWTGSINSDQKYVLDDGSHFPALLLTEIIEDTMYNIDLNVIMLDGDSTISGWFYDTSTEEFFSTITAAEYYLRKQYLRLAIMQSEIILDSHTFFGITNYPKRYACKPYCIMWNFGEKTFGTNGLTASTPDKPWNLRVNSGIVVKQITGGQNIPDSYNLNTTLIYNLTNDMYSVSRGAPYIEIEKEVVDIIDINKISLDRFPVVVEEELDVVNEPLTVVDGFMFFPTDITKRVPVKTITSLEYFDGGIWNSYAKDGYGPSANWNISTLFGAIYLTTKSAFDTWRFSGTLMKQNPVISLTAYSQVEDISGYSTEVEDLTVISIDNRTGEVTFSSPSQYDYLNGTDGHWIEADYTYREEFLVYDGWNDSGISGEYKYIFDVCPYDGHYIYNDISESVEKTIDNIGNNIYVYALPSIMNNSQLAGGIYHTFDPTIFDQSSINYNPLALRIATIVMRQSIDSSMLVKIDTRRGGGGFTDEQKNKILVENKEESIWDFTSLDGDVYFLGGSVIVSLPLTWKTYWVAREIIYKNITEFEATRNIEEWVLNTAKKYGPAGKHYYIKWETEDIS